MNAELIFEPVRPAHAIERCAATVLFSAPLPLDKLHAVARQASLEPNWSRLSAIPGAGVEITVDTQTGKLSLQQVHNTLNYSFASGGTPVLCLQPNMITWQTDKYVRWTPFQGDIENFVMSVLKEYNKFAPIAAIKLEYWDRFIWQGKLSNMEPFFLLRENSGLLPGAAIKPGQAWHNHCGWFERGPRGGRRLVNANVDVQIGPNPEALASNSIMIYTMMQDDSPASPFINASDVVPSFDALHQALKVLLKQLISDQMAARISLAAGANT